MQCGGGAGGGAQGVILAQLAGPGGEQGHVSTLLIYSSSCRSAQVLSLALRVE